MSRTQSRKKPTHRPRPLPVSRSAPPGVRGGSWGRRLRWLAASLFLLSAIPVLVLRWLPPPTSMFMLIERASALLDGDRQYRIHYRWVGWDAISPQAKLAVVASEDQTFARHLGFDFKAMEQALERNRAGKPLRGGSTITQQTAKNLFLYPGRSYLRKILEAYFTLLVELSWPKQRILEVYLNIAEFGDGIYGVEAAAQMFFHKAAARLNSEEAARLAAVLPNPKRLHVDDPSRYVQKRKAWIQGQMRILGGRHVLDEL